MSGDITTHLDRRTGRLRLTVTEMDETGLNTIVVSMPPTQALVFARTIADALGKWEAAQ